MHLVANSLDDLMRKVLRVVVKKGERVKARKGWNKEISGVVLELKNPTARLSRTETKGTVFSCLGETLWYLAKSNKLAFIKHYISQYSKYAELDGTIHGAYGPRLFAMRNSVDQIANIRKLLTDHPTSRKAVLQLFNAEDLLKDYKDIPCTCTLQFLCRAGRLNAVGHMRSNDAFLGLPHDIFAFTFIQEILARSMRLEVGTYKHLVGSLHIYEEHEKKVANFLAEGFQSRIAMPSMPLGDPWPNVKSLLEIESRLRLGKIVDLQKYKLGEYWSDLARLLAIFAAAKRRRATGSLKSKMISKIYNPYIDKLVARKAEKS